MDSETKESALELDYAEITNWGCSKDIFVLSLGEIHALNKIYFHAPQAPLMCWMMNAYTNLMANKDPDIDSLIQKYNIGWNKRLRRVNTFAKFSG